MSRRLDVALVLTHPVEDYFPDWGGVTDWIHFLDLHALSLTRRGHQVVKVIPSPSTRRPISYRHKFGHEILRLPTAGSVASAALLRHPYAQAWGFSRCLAREVEARGIDAVQFANYYTSYFVPAAHVAKTTPVVVTYAGGAMPRGAARAIWRAALRPALRRTSAVLIGDYPYEIPNLTDELRVPRARIHPFQMLAVDESVFHHRGRAEAKRKLGWDESKSHLLTVTRLPPPPVHDFEKDPYRLISQFAAMPPASRTRAILHVVGWGPGAEAVQRQVDALGLQRQVVLHGFKHHAELAEHYRAADLMFLPFKLHRLNEGLATFEAFFCGLPVLAWRRDPTAPDQRGGALIDADPTRGAPELAAFLGDAAWQEGKREEALSETRGHSLAEVGAQLEKVLLDVTAARHKPI